VVIGAEDCGSSSCVDIERSPAILLGLLNQFLKFRRNHAALEINWDRPNVVSPEATHLSSFFERVVSMSTGEEDEFTVTVACGLGFWVQVVASDDYRSRIGGAASLS